MINRLATLPIGNEQDCICHKPNGKHRNNCNAFRLSEFLKRCGACTKVRVTDVNGKQTVYESASIYGDSDLYSGVND